MSQGWGVAGAKDSIAEGLGRPGQNGVMKFSVIDNKVQRCG